MAGPRRILALWFPRLAAEQALRGALGGADPTGTRPFAVVEELGNARQLRSLSLAASEAGLTVGQPLRDALAMCPDLVTINHDTARETAFLRSLCRWAGRFSPWVGQEPPASLNLDISGCAHLFGGEAALLDQITQQCADMGLTVRAAIADTLGTAWGMARYVGDAGPQLRSGDAVDQEARATRARAAKRRRWERGGLPPQVGVAVAQVDRIAPVGHLHQALGALPVAALRLDEATLAMLNRLGLRRVQDLFGIQRAALARRFGQRLVLRLDQALGLSDEPLSPEPGERVFAVRMTLPEPIGLESDVLAAMDRLLPELCKRLKSAGRGARRVLLQAFRTNQSSQTIEIGLARPMADWQRIRSLLAMKTGEIDAGFGIDLIRIEASQTEPVSDVQVEGHLAASERAARRGSAPEARIEDLMSRIGARIGLERVRRLHPGDSHIPEKSAVVLAAAWSEPARDWRAAPGLRPVLLWPSEPVTVLDDTPGPWPLQFRWRRRTYQTVAAAGAERISPEWWLDDPEWRSGARDYWRITTSEGARLWLYNALGGTKSGGWFCQGDFG